MRIIANYLDRECVLGKGFTVELINPATEQVRASLIYASEEQLKLAYEKASQAQEKWRQTSVHQRSEILINAAQILRKRTQELAELEVSETGKPISEALSVDITSAAEALEYFAKLVIALKGDYYQLGHNYAYVTREPLGVVAGIGAWNYPLQIAAWKSAPALAAGNSMIFKPSELTPSTAIELAKAYREAGLPGGVFQVVQGSEQVGQWLVDHPGIAKISLTGEVATGKKVMAQAAQNLKSLTLELGGKSPLIITEKANIEDAVQGAMLANFYTQGEVCSNGTRVFVHHSIEQEFKKKLIQASEKLKVGDPMDASTQVGALISESHMKRVLSIIAQAQKDGAKLECGGQRVGQKGYFIAPTIFSACQDDMPLVQNEIFAPVLSLLSYRDEEEVIKRANQTDYGLAAGVFSSDLNQAQKIAQRIQAGICWINSYNITPLEVPFGGMKHSGLGRENSFSGLTSYTQEKTIYVETEKLESPYREV